MNGVAWEGPPSRIFPEPIDHFDRLPNALLLLVFNNIGNVKALGRCCVVSRRFHSLVHQVETVVVRFDCVISDDDSSLSPSSSSIEKPRSLFGNLLLHVSEGIGKPLRAMGQLLGTERTQCISHNSRHHHGGPDSRVASDDLRAPSGSGSGTTWSVGGATTDDEERAQGGVTRYSPTQVLKNFHEIRLLRIELPSEKLRMDDGVLWKWRADFGSTLDNCVILGATSVLNNDEAKPPQEVGATDLPCVRDSNNNDIIDANDGSIVDDKGSIPGTFYTHGGLQSRVAWAIRSLIAASTRHYLIQSVVAKHKTLDRLVLTDADGQGVLCMNREQLEELRLKPASAACAFASACASKRTLVPALRMRLWYAPHLELPYGDVLKGATLVALRPTEAEQSGVKKEVCDGPWVGSAFEEPYGTAAKMLAKRRAYCMDINSF